MWVRLGDKKRIVAVDTEDGVQGRHDTLPGVYTWNVAWE